MFNLLKLVLIILFHKTYAYVIQDTQTILLPAWDSTNANNIPTLTLKAFGLSIQLNLHRTDYIVPASIVWKYNTISVLEKWMHLKTLNPCFYVHEDRITFAVINFCQEHGLEGLIFLNNDILEIKPFEYNFASLSLLEDFCIRKQVNLSFGTSHRIKKLQQSFNNLNFHHSDNVKSKQRYIRSTQKKLVIELAVFVDEAAYKIFMPILDNNEENLRNMILAYVNNIQAMYHNPSFGVPLDISLIRLEIMKKQPKDLPVSKDAEQVLYSFCQYAATQNHPDDNNKHHWDIGLYLTGINTGQNLIGKAYRNTICNFNYSCVIVKFGDNNLISGFASSIVAVHEIGHVIMHIAGIKNLCTLSLGIKHDPDPPIKSQSSEMHCPNYKHIMTTDLSYRGHVTWSKCSRDVAQKLWKTRTCLLDHTIQGNHEDELDHMRYHNLPGREWTAKAQCELYSLDKDANVVTMHDMCQTLHCETKHLEKKYFFARPALEGTQCALGKECRGGECVPVIEPPYIFKYCKEDEWSEWKKDDCQSPCLTKSKGVIIKRRSCKRESHKTSSCVGPYYAIDLCDDSRICKNRRTIEEFTKTKCTEFSKILKSFGKMYLTEIEKKAGWQAPHNVKKPWTACTIFCEQKHIPHISRRFYSPYEELLSIDVDPYFPDGTWCHYQDGQNYYCRHHYCLPENYSVE